MDVITSTVDARGQSCPGPLVTLHRALKDLSMDMKELRSDLRRSGRSGPPGSGTARGRGKGEARGKAQARGKGEARGKAQARGKGKARGTGKSVEP